MRTFKPIYKDRKSGQWKETKNYYCELRDHLGTVRRFPGFVDKTATQAFGLQIQRLISCRSAGEQPKPDLSRWLEQTPAKLRQRFAKIGLLDVERASGGKPLSEHLNDFEQFLRAKGNTEKHAKLVVSRARKVVEGCKFFYWMDISASKVQRYLAELRDQKDKDGNNIGISAQTFNFYLQAIKEFARWMIQDRRASESPIQHLKGLNVRTDRRHDRRALSIDEIRRLLETTALQTSRYGMTGSERALLYRLAVETGLRANELRTLKVSAIDFDNCLVVVEAAYSKHRRRDVLPLRPDTAAQLKQLIKGKLLAAPMFNMPKPNRVVFMLKDDLQAAKIDYQDTAGRYADFHSLRHTTGTLLAAAGVHPRTAQNVMRHSTIELTMNKYTHTTLGQTSQAVESLPDLSLPSNQSQQAKATGTDGKSLPENLPFYNASQCASVLSVAETTHNNNSEPPKEQAAVGFEPTNNGFANRPLRPLGYAANAIRYITRKLRF